MNWTRIKSAYEWLKKEQEHMRLEEEFSASLDDDYWESLTPPPEDATSFFSSVPEEPSEVVSILTNEKLNR